MTLHADRRATAALVLVSGLSVALGDCQPWCDTYNCEQNACMGCRICSTYDEGPETCREWCMDEHEAWRAKCMWDNCYECEDCQGLAPKPSATSWDAPSSSFDDPFGGTWGGDAAMGAAAGGASFDDGWQPPRVAAPKPDCHAHGPCESWCAAKADPWSVRCTWNECAGCDECSTCKGSARSPTTGNHGAAAAGAWNAPTPGVPTLNVRSPANGQVQAAERWEQQQEDEDEDEDEDEVDEVDEEAPRCSKEKRCTHVKIVGEAFHINGRPTHEGRTWKGASIEGLLMNSRMINGLFDDLNEHTRHKLWAYPDTGKWDPDRNTDELLASLPSYVEAGLDAITVGLQGGSPCGNNPRDGSAPCHDMYNRDASSYNKDGSLRAGAFERLERLLDRADELGMVVIVQMFYPDEAFKTFGSHHHGGGDDGIHNAADKTVDWLAERKYKNVLIDVCNECDCAPRPSQLCPRLRIHASRALQLQHFSKRPMHRQTTRC